MSTDNLELIVTNALNGHLAKIIDIKQKDDPEEDLYTVKVLHLIKSDILKCLSDAATLQTTFTKINSQIFEVHFADDKNLTMKCLVDEINHLLVTID